MAKFPVKSMIRVGDVFGKLTVVKFAGYYVHKSKVNTHVQKHAQWLCKCECGAHVQRPIQGRTLRFALKRKRIPSCGCARNDHKKIGKGQNGFNKLYKNYQLAAKSRGIPFKISKTLFKKLTSSDCFYCGAKPSSISTQGRHKSSRQHAAYVYNGVDRVVNSRPYERSNVVPCCSLCNYAKRDLSLKNFVEWVGRLKKSKLKKFLLSRGGK